MKDYVQLTKPRITWLILASTGVGYYFGRTGGNTWWTLLHCLLGTALIASGTAALNQWYEREADGRMLRTRQRPIPAGKVSARNALLFGIALSILGFVELWLGCNLLTAGLGLFTLVSYLFAYTPMKQKSWWSTTVGAVPGAMPPLIGYAASANALTWDAWALYAILFCWQFPHFYAIAWMYREDYGRAGIQMLPVVEPDGESTARQMVLYSLLLLPVSLLPSVLHMSGPLYLVSALVLGAMYVASSYQVARGRTVLQARHVLRTSVIYLPLLYGLLMLDHGLLR